MRILIIGCNGMIGHTVALYFKEHHHDVFGYDNIDGSFVEQTTGNLHDEDCLHNCINSFNPDAVINCTAIVNQAAEEDRADALFVNAYLPHLLEKWTANSNAVVVHRSTDCIFSGDRGQYTLEDIPDAKSFYARTKAIGELLNDKDITIRVSLIGPALTASDSSLLNWFLQQKGDVRGFANAIWTGLTTLEYAKTIGCLLAHKAHGLFQAAPPTSISKYNLLKLFKKYFSGCINIIKVDNARVDKSLVPSWGGYDICIGDYEAQIIEMKKWIQAHSSIYPEYYSSK